MYKLRLKEVREEPINFIHQKDLAKLLNIHVSVYCQYEGEANIFPLEYLDMLCNYFNTSLDYIFNFTDLRNYINSDKINLTLFSKRLKEIRIDNHLTQKQLASILNIRQSTISKYEHGINTIATPFLYTICKKYNISADYLLGKTNEPKYLN